MARAHAERQTNSGQVTCNQIGSTQRRMSIRSGSVGLPRVNHPFICARLRGIASPSPRTCRLRCRLTCSNRISRCRSRASRRALRTARHILPNAIGRRLALNSGRAASRALLGVNKTRIKLAASTPAVNISALASRRSSRLSIGEGRPSATNH